MKAQGKTLLRVTGVIELLFGIGLIGMLMFALSSNDVALLKSLGLSGEAKTFFSLFTSYAQAIVDIIAGILGIMLADKPKHYKINFFFGLLLILLVAANFGNKDLGSIQTIISQSVSLLVPVFYFYGAVKNKQSL